MDINLIMKILPFVAEAGLTTIKLAVASFMIGLAVSALLVAARFSRHFGIRAIATAYVSVMRGTPLLVQLFLVFFGTSQFGMELTPFVAGILTLGFNIGAYMSEGMRGAILSVDKGQTEAARTLGFGRFDTMRLFVLPQARPLLLRSLGVNTVILTKGTALVSTIGVVELTYSAQRFVTSTYKPFEVFGVAGAAYIIIIAVILAIARFAEASYGGATAP
ncbi:amino acid ABC transporter permease [Rhizobium etli]|uniref:amino acid ABC transporter permease n=1 Tax=Rhizobium etli TaxID=29449 RepID=UPI0003839CD7|nr:amino acid ABC transporter permease [Rhizobium etli]AGS24407.1 amino acid ABC transporter permease protein [Rhizobium etli bv. mimosae str. Mim1]